MIISYSNNFVVIRPPKTGSTSLSFYFLASGLVDAEKDFYVIDKDFLCKAPDKYKQAGRHGSLHRTFDDLRANGAVPSEMPCVSTIRNPLERLSSSFNFLRAMHLKHDNRIPEEYSGPNVFWDAVKNKGAGFAVKGISRPQTDYSPDHAELFNTENLHEHVSKYILERGGKVDGRIEMRKNPDNKLDVFLAELTPDRKQDILDTYAKDFELWEKAYAVYN